MKSGQIDIRTGERNRMAGVPSPSRSSGRPTEPVLPSAPAAEPLYAGLRSAGAADAGAAHRSARRRMRRRRRLNAALSYAATITAIAAIGAAAFLGYQLYQDDQERQVAERQGGVSAPAIRNAAGTVGLLGAQAPPVADASPLTLTELMPDAFIEMATRGGDSGRFAVFTVNETDFSTSYPSEYLEWVGRLQAQPRQLGETVAVESLPAAVRGQILLAIRTDGVTVFEAVVVSREPDLQVLLGS